MTHDRDREVYDLLCRWASLCERGQAISIAELCREHPELADEVGRRVQLLQAQGGAPAALASQAPELSSMAHKAAVESVSAETLPERKAETPFDLSFLAPAQSPDELGRLAEYRILKLLGQGGMGMVFAAEDTKLQRRVALKVVRPDRSVGEEARKRFLREARTLAQVEHEHVIAIHHVGEANAVPYIVMPLLKGEPLADRLRRQPALSLGEVVRIGREIAEGLAAAHAVGLIHRDIKPGNIWLEGERAKVKLLDFGLARSAETAEPLTECGALVGTPLYMSPEQAAGSAALDGRSDMFSVGSVLYQMLTGRCAFRGPNTLAILRNLAVEEPTPPHELDAATPVELSQLTMRLLAKEREKRPGSAQEVADALSAIEQAAARQMAAPTERLPAREAPLRAGGRRWALVGLAVLLLAGAALYWAPTILHVQGKHGTLVVKVHEPGVEVFVDGEAKLVIDSKKLGRLELLPGPHKLVLKRGKEELHAESFELKSGEELLIEARWVARPDTAKQGTASVLWKPGPKKDVLPGIATRPAELPGVRRWQVRPVLPPNTWWELALSPDGKAVAFGTRMGDIEIYDASSMRLLRVLWGSHASPISYVAWHPKGERLATGTWDGFVRFWGSDGKPGPVLKGHTGQVHPLGWNPDGNLLCSGGYVDKTVRVWDRDGKAGPVLKHDGNPQCLAWSPDGGTLAVSENDRNSIRLWDTAKWTQKGTIGPLAAKYAWGLAWSPNGKLLATAGGDLKDGLAGYIWEVTTGNQKVTLRGPSGQINSMKWLSGDLIAIGSQDGFVQLMDAQSGRVITPTPQSESLNASFSADGKRIADTNGSVWDVDGTQLQLVASSKVARLLYPHVDWSHDGEWLAVSGSQQTRLWDVNGKVGPVLKHKLEVPRHAWSPTEQRLACALGDGTVSLWNADGTRGPFCKAHQGKIHYVAWSPDGKRLASAGEDGVARLWDAEGNPGVILKGHEGAVNTVCWSSKHKLVTGGSDKTVRLWKVSGVSGPILKGHDHTVSYVCWRPDGGQLASSDDQGTIRLWGADGVAGPVLKSHQGHVDVRWSPDGKRLVSAGRGDGSIRLWERDGTEVDCIKHAAAVYSVAWSARNKLAWGMDGNMVRVASAEGEPLWTAVALSGKHSATFNPAGTLLHGDPDAVESELVYLVESEAGRIEILRPSEFRKRFGAGSGLPPRE